MKVLGDIYHQLQKTPLMDQAVFDPDFFLLKCAKHLLQRARQKKGFMVEPTLYWHKATVVPENCQPLLSQWIKEIMHGIPFAHIVQEAFFYKSAFYVNENVLIPRPETEQLVVATMDAVGGMQGPLQGFELGIGSGIISLSLLLERSDLKMVASDCCARALEVAEKNAHALLEPLSRRLTVFCCEKTHTLENFFAYGPYDFFVSNPPYLADATECTPAVFHYEPSVALFSKPDPLFFYKKIAAMVPDLLKPHAMVFLEMPHERAQQIFDIFSFAFDCTLQKDLNGRERILVGRKK